MNSNPRYDYFKHTLLRQRVPGLDYQFKDNLLVHALASCMAGTVATSESQDIPLNTILKQILAACAPFDVIKSRVMSEVSIHHHILQLSFLLNGDFFFR